VSLIFPAGITKLHDLPFPYFEAIRTALAFLSFDELPKDERPSRDIWMEPDELRTHFKAVERRREEKYGNSNSSSEIDGPTTENDTEAILGMTR
jgi:hypothetical protein